MAVGGGTFSQGNHPEIRSLLIQDRQSHAGLHQEWQLVDLLQRLLDERSRAGLQRDHERQLGRGETGLLEDGIDVDSSFREDGGQRGNDAGLVLYHKAQVVAGGEVGADREVRQAIFMDGHTADLAKANDRD